MINKLDLELPVGTMVIFKEDIYFNDYKVDEVEHEGKIAYVYPDFIGKYSVDVNGRNFLVYNSDILEYE